MSSDTGKMDEVETNKDDCLNALVSFYELNIYGEKFPICAGIFIKSNLIFVTRECSESLNEISKIMLTSRRNNFDDTFLNFILTDKKVFENSNFGVLIVSSST